VTDYFGHAFRDPDLLRRALRHRSAGPAHNERLEFLGDALVNLIVAQALYEHWPRADEGALTRARASLVRESALADVARRLGLGEFMELGPGEMKSGGHRRDSILADALEALVGAIHLDAGFEACRDAVLPWFEPGIRALPTGKVDKDAKTQLQEWLQARQLARPEYTLVETRGQEHARVFRVACETREPAHRAEAEAASVRAAEQAAAERVLEILALAKAAGRADG
jgi:ribonuclease-3